MQVDLSNDAKKKWFCWGLVLAWVPSIPFILGISILGISTSFRGQKATGIGAVAGALAEVYLPLGILVTSISEIAAIVLLIRSLSKAHGGRRLFSLLTVGWSALVVLLNGLLVSLFFIQMRSMNG
jgi:hypothetical protein